MDGILTLDTKGVALALAFGIVVLLAGGVYGPFLLAVILIFLVLSTLVTRMGHSKKRDLPGYSKIRGWKNVLANGVVPLIAALLLLDAGPYSRLVVLGYVAAVAAITADKFGSEVGVFDKHAWTMLTMRKAKPGISGAVSVLGLGASLLGAAIVSLPLLLIGYGIAALVICIVAGFLGSVVDSFFGYYEEMGIGNKYTSNFLCSAAGFCIAMAVPLLLNLRM